MKKKSKRKNRRPGARPDASPTKEPIDTTRPIAAARCDPTLDGVPTAAADAARPTNVGDQTRFMLLEQIRDFTHKDVVLADTKAGLALTIVAASVAAYAALFEKLSHGRHLWQSLQTICGVSGLLAGSLSVLFAMLTILPRSYISHEMATSQSHWIQMRSGIWHGLRRRIFDGLSVVTENMWQRQTKGTPQSLEMLLERALRQSEVNEVMYVSMRRAVLVQNLKYLWVGKAIVCAFGTFILVGVSVLLGVLPSVDTSQQVPLPAATGMDGPTAAAKPNDIGSPERPEPEVPPAPSHAPSDVQPGDEGGPSLPPPMTVFLEPTARARLEARGIAILLADHYRRARSLQVLISGPVAESQRPHLTAITSLLHATPTPRRQLSGL